MSDEKTFNADEIKAAMKQNSEEIKTLIADASGKAEKAGRTADETVNRLEALVAESKKLDTRLASIEQAQHGVSEGKARETLGEQFTKSDAFKAMIEGRNTVAKVEFKTALVNATLNTSQPLVPSDMVAGPQALPFREFTIYNLLPKGTTASNHVTFPRATRTNNAGPQNVASPTAYTEGSTKRESAYSFTQVGRPILTLAHTLPVSTQIMEDAPFLESWLNTDMVTGLMEEVEDQALLGSGTQGNLSGLVTEADAFADTSPTVAGANNLTRIRSAIRQLQIQNFNPNFIVLSPTDWYLLEVERVAAGTDDRYIWANPQNAGDKRLWGVPVIVSNAISDGTYLIGDINQAMLFEKGGISFQAAYQDGDNFKQNMVTLRAETRCALIVKRTEAFVTGSIT